MNPQYQNPKQAIAFAVIAAVVAGAVAWFVAVLAQR